MPTSFETLLEKTNEIHDIDKASQLLSWDRQVIMPHAAEEVRVHQIATLNRLSHELFVSDETGRLLEEAAAEVAGLPYDSDEASLIRHLQWDYENQRKLPADFVKRRSLVSGRAHTIWREARENNDFSAFAPWLKQIVELAQEMAELWGYEDEPYDALLDKYERGMKTADVAAIFAHTREETVPLLQAIEERGASVDDRMLHQHFPIPQQEEFARYIAAAAGYDFDRGYLGTSVHPFSSSFNRDDARITTRWNEHFLNPALFATLHESGHAIYEQGTHPDLARTPLARGTSSGIHESQSRMFENVVGRSRGFWRAHYTRLQETFPQQLGHVELEDFYRAINKVQPSFIRVEADELTYALHIILRFELERALIQGSLSVDDLPEAWNSRFEELLGIVPPDDRQGVLQDIHWTWPSFGYFPTYALGNLYGAQLFQAAREQAPAIDAELEAGKTDALLGWLRENIHQHGRKFTPSEIVQRATGRPLSHKPFIAYVTEKFGDVYQL